jgi:hypothetical protein
VLKIYNIYEICDSELFLYCFIENIFSIFIFMLSFAQNLVTNSEKEDVG